MFKRRSFHWRGGWHQIFPALACIIIWLSRTLTPIVHVQGLDTARELFRRKLDKLTSWDVVLFHVPDWLVGSCWTAGVLHYLFGRPKIMSIFWSMQHAPLVWIMGHLFNVWPFGLWTSKSCQKSRASAATSTQKDVLNVTCHVCLGLAGKETLSSGHEAVYKIGAPNQLGQLAQIIVAWPRQGLRGWRWSNKNTQIASNSRWDWCDMISLGQVVKC